MERQRVEPHSWLERLDSSTTALLPKVTAKPRECAEVNGLVELRDREPGES